MLCLVQLSKRRESKATDAEKLLSQWEKVGLCNFRSKTQVHERCFFLMKWNVICNAEDIFSCFRALLHITSLEFRAFWKLLSQWEKVGLCNFRSKTQVHERCFFLMKLNVICNAEDIFSCFRAFLQFVMLELQCTKSLV